MPGRHAVHSMPCDKPQMIMFSPEAGMEARLDSVCETCSRSCINYCVYSTSVEVIAAETMLFPFPAFTSLTRRSPPD